jgi:hypothetical protein
MSHKHSLRLLLPLIAAGLVCAQTAPPVTVEASRTDGKTIGLTVRNSGSAVVTAFVLTFEVAATTAGRQKVHTTVFLPFDAATGALTGKVIPAHSSVDFAIPASWTLPPSATVSAVVFADSTSWGNPTLTARISRRRVHLGKHLRTALDELTAMLGRSAGLADAISEMESHQQADVASAADQDEGWAVRSVYLPALSMLRQASQARADAGSAVNPLLRTVSALAARQATLISIAGDRP